MIARLDKISYFADSLGRKRSTYSFLSKKYRRMISQKLQKTDNLYGFNANYSAFLLFKFYQRSLNVVLDVHIWNFMSNFL